MDFITPLVNIFSSLLGSIGTRVSYLVNVETRVHSLTTVMNELKEKRDDVKRKVDAAEFVQLTCRTEVKGWLQRIESVEREVDTILEDLGRRRRCLGTCYMNCSSNYELSKRIKEKLSDVTELGSKGGFNSVVDPGLPPAIEERPSSSTVGLDVMLRIVREELKEETVGIVGIYGMGGVGKTTLLREINNEFLTESHDFDVVIWVLVSKDFVVDKIQKAVGERLGLVWEENKSQEQRAMKIFKVLRKKKFMLLLDDVWERVDLEKTGIPLPSRKNKCKVILTTRDMQVCSDMDAQKKLKVEFLKEEAAWKLFRKRMGSEEVLDSPSIRPLADIIVKKCGGLPLALITVGRAMANKVTIEEWKDAVRILNKSPSELRGMEDVFTLLRFTYDNLQDETSKSCFLYCSLFPEDYSIQKEQLIEYWLGEGILDRFDDNDAYNKGHAIIGALKVACLLETGAEETQVKMHDVIRGLALWIASERGKNDNKVLVQASVGLTEAPRVERWKEAERISLMDNEITALTEIPVCPNLLTLMLQWNSGLNRITNGFFHFMPALRVLDLSLTSLKELPVAIGELVELRHLDLSGTKITELPKEIGGLAKLRHLDLQRTHFLKTIPSDAVSRLSRLEVLNLYYSYWNWDVESSENGICYTDLERLASLTSLGITITELETLFRLSRLKSLPKCVQYLYIRECEGLTHFQPSLTSGNAEKLRRLSINNCYELEELVIGMEAGENWLPSLEVLSLYGLPNLSIIWRRSVTRGCLKNLRCINIWHCEKLKNVTWVLQLQNLEVLYIFYCMAIEEVISTCDVPNEYIILPKLRTLSIRDLPKLRNIYMYELDFPSLERIAVSECPRLKKLPLRANNPKMIPTIYGATEWWDGLEWENDDTKSTFLPSFTAI